MLKSLGFHLACSHAVQDREAAHKRYQSLRTPANHDLYISAHNREKSIFRPKIFSSIESVKTLLFVILPVTSGIFPKISPNLLLHLSLPSLTLTAALPSLLFLKLNSFLNPSEIFWAYSSYLSPLRLIYACH